jgi:hypothetical protein
MSSLIIKVKSKGKSMRVIVNMAPNIGNLIFEPSPISSGTEEMRQPRLMKLSRTDIDRNWSSSDLASIALVYFPNSRGLKKLVLVRQLNPFEFFFDCRKQIKVTNGRVR